MALKLTIEPSAGYCMSDAEARRAGEEGRAKRERLRRVADDGDAVAIPTTNQVVKLLRAGHLRPEQARAAQEIDAYYHHTTRHLHARCGLYAERMPRSPDADPTAAERNRAARYLGWAAWAETQAVTPGLSLTTLTLDLVVDGYSIDAIRVRRALSHRRALRLIQGSLWQYALRAGWAVEHPKRAA